MKKFLLTFILVAIGIAGFSQYSGKIIKIYDGNTFWVKLDDGNTDSVKFYGIDCPELEQQYGEAAKGHLEKQLYREVKLDYQGRDKENYMLAIVTYTNKRGDVINLNEELISKGYAWKNKYTKDKNLEKLEKKARNDKVGLWRNDNPVPPWEYRKKK